MQNASPPIHTKTHFKLLYIHTHTYQGHIILKMKGIAVILGVVLAVISLAAAQGEAISCADIQSSLYPCLAYLTGGGEPTESCCGSVRSLSGSIQSQQDRQTACNCMKSAASSFGVRPDSAVNLPEKCGVSIGMTVTPNIDYSQVS